MLPVFEPGALFFLGDGHARQGDGEVVGSAIETSLDVEFSVDLIKGKKSTGLASKIRTTSWFLSQRTTSTSASAPATLRAIAALQLLPLPKYLSALELPVRAVLARDLLASRLHSNNSHHRRICLWRGFSFANADVRITCSISEMSVQ
jgi:hypothetical protein